MTQADQEITLGGNVPTDAMSYGTPGQLLAAGRQKLGWSVGDVAAKLRMSVQQVDALEQGNYGRLPTGTFLRGFVRSYAKLVALDPAQILQALEETHADARKPAIVPPTQNIALSSPGERFASPRIRLLLLSALAIALAGGTAYWWLHIRPDAGRLAERSSAKSEPVAVPLPTLVTPQASVDPSASPAQGAAAQDNPAATTQTAATTPAGAAPGTLVPAAAQPGTPSTTVPAAPAAVVAAEAQPAALTQTTAPLAPAAGQDKPVVVPKGSGSLKFSFTGECWVEVTEASGKTLLSRRFKAGESETVIGKLPVSVAIGNAPVTKLKYNDVDFDLAPHTRVAVARFTLK